MFGIKVPELNISAAKSEVSAKIVLQDGDIQLIKQQTSNGAKYIPIFENIITDAQGELITKIQKTLY